jgi:hypothetical protein
VDRCRISTRWLACHRPDRDGLLLRERDTSDEREIVPELARENRGGWTLSDRAVFFSAAHGDGIEAGIHRFDLERAERRLVASLRPNAIGDTLTVAPDESILVIARTDAIETDLMYVPPPTADPIVDRPQP